MPVINANVTAELFDFDNHAFASEIVLRDDGFGADKNVDDGIYSVILDGLLLQTTEAGDYEVCATVQNNEVGIA